MGVVSLFFSYNDGKDPLPPSRLVTDQLCSSPQFIYIRRVHLFVSFPDTMAMSDFDSPIPLFAAWGRSFSLLVYAARVRHVLCSPHKGLDLFFPPPSLYEVFSFTPKLR